MAMQLDYTRLKPSFIKRKGLEVKAIFKVTELERLLPLLASEEGELSADCEFIWPQDSDILMKLVLNGAFNVSCKRCLEPFKHDWHSDVTLKLCSDEPLDEHTSDEPYERVTLAHDGSFNLIDVIIDDLILGLPERHPTACPDNMVANLID